MDRGFGRDGRVRNETSCAGQTFSFAIGLCVLLRWMFPHSSTRSQTLCGGTASLHCGQTFRAGATRKSWLRRFPLADLDVRLFGTATTDSPETTRSGVLAKKAIIRIGLGISRSTFHRSP